MVWDSSRVGRPPRWMRVMFLVFALVFASRLLLGSPQPIECVQTALLCGFMVFCAISPRAIYDGRAGVWERAHPVRAAGLSFLFLGLLMFNALSIFLDPLVSVLISVGFSAVFAPWAVWRGRRRNHLRHPGP